MSHLSGRRALVTGGSQGIGFASALALARREARVTILARDAGGLTRALGELPGPGHDMIAADLADPEEAVCAVRAMANAGGAYDIVVLNAGGPPGGPLTDAPLDAFRQAFTTHLLSAQALLQALLPSMRDRGFGRVITILSTSVKQPIRGLGVSNTIRAAMANWSKTLATELAPHGITVNNILPGATRTRRLEALIAAQAEAAGSTVADQTHGMLAAIPMGRFAEPGEVAAAVAFLASPEASYITGINLPVDGGRTGSL